MEVNCMLKPAFSTVSCPHWTLREVANNADAFGYEAVELRTYGDDSSRSACDPALSSPEKIRETFGDHGVEIMCLATSQSFDRLFGPPVLGPALWDQEESVRRAQKAIDLAASLECPFVRVYGFRVAQSERRGVCLARIVERLRSVVDHADKTGVRVVLENGGSFATAKDIRELIEACDHPLLGACYGNAAAMLAGEDPVEGVRTLGAKLWVARVQDAEHPANASSEQELRPCRLGAGKLHAAEFVGALRANGFSGPLVYEHNTVWQAGEEPVEALLPAAAKTMFAWATGTGDAVSTNAVSAASKGGGHRQSVRQGH